MDTIREFWHSLAALARGRGSSAHSRKEMRTAFYAGAAATIEIIGRAVESDPSGVTVATTFEALRLESELYVKDPASRPPF